MVYLESLVKLKDNWTVWTESSLFLRGIRLKTIPFRFRNEIFVVEKVQFPNLSHEIRRELDLEAFIYFSRRARVCDSSERDVTPNDEKHTRNCFGNPAGHVTTGGWR